MNLQKTYSVDEATKRLENYCTYQDRCHQEIERKLMEMRMIPEAREKIILHLLQHDFLDEERFAKAFVRGKFRIKKWGRQRLSLELKKRKIHPNLIDLALKEINDEDYIDTFNILAEKKFETINSKNKRQKKKKLADYLFYRGWESHLVFDKIRELTSKI